MEKIIYAAILTISDRSYKKEREDLSGPAIIAKIKSLGFTLFDYKIVPDEKEQIVEALNDWAEKQVALIFTTGGTGFSPRDITPEAVRSVLDKETPGISEYLRYKSFQLTPHAVLSRAVSGIKNKSLIINLPGSPKAAIECIDFLTPVLPHALELIADDPIAEENH